jgi:hypothetical protein
MPESETITVENTEVEIEPIKPLSGGGARVDLEADDGRKWRVDVKATGEKKQIVTTWKNGALADLEDPDWLDRVLARLGRAA